MSINAAVVGVGSLKQTDLLCQGPNSIRGLITRHCVFTRSPLLDQLIDPGIAPRRTAITRGTATALHNRSWSRLKPATRNRARICARTHSGACPPRALTQSHPRSSLRGAAAGRLFVVSGECVRLLSWTGKSRTSGKLGTLGMQTTSFPTLTVYRCDRDDRSTEYRDRESVYRRFDYFGDFDSENNLFYRNII